MNYYGDFLFPESGEIKRGRIGVQNGRIVEFSDKIESHTIVGQALPGITTPGLIDAHVHLILDGSADPLSSFLKSNPNRRVLLAQKHLMANLEAGVTTVRDLGCPDGVALELGRAVAEGLIVGSRVVACGHNITMTGGHGHAFGREADGADGVRQAARAELKAGAQVLKFMATGGVLTEGVKAGAAAFTEAEMRAGVEEAHKVGRLTAAHAQGLIGIKNALRAGIDTIEHGSFDRWDDEALGLLQDRFLVPTLAAPAGIMSGEGSVPAWVIEKTRPIADRHRETTLEAYRAGIRIAAGTDAGTPLNPHGNLPTELELLAAVGLKPLDVLRAATTVAAAALGLEGEIGTFNLGAAADFVTWEENPLENPLAYRQPQVIIRAGQVVKNLW